MIGAILAALRLRAALAFLSARPALKWALVGLALALALWGALAALSARERAQGAAEARRELDAQQIQEVKDAIIRSAPGPRPSGGEFLDCLRRAGPGCL